MDPKPLAGNVSIGTTHWWLYKYQRIEQGIAIHEILILSVIPINQIKHLAAYVNIL